MVVYGKVSRCFRVLPSHLQGASILLLAASTEGFALFVNSQTKGAALRLCRVKRA